MAPAGSLSFEDDEADCRLPFEEPDGTLVYFDVQNAEPGAFTEPGVIEMETYAPGENAELSWIYFKGDPMAGPQPGHPFDMPFDNSLTNFTLDLVTDDDQETVLQNVMPPTNSTPFWQGGAPFGKRGNHTLAIYGLDRSCRYDHIGQMTYFWRVPDNLDVQSVYRMRLTSDEPEAVYLSGKFQMSGSTAGSLSVDTADSSIPDIVASGNAAFIPISFILIMLVLSLWGCVRSLRASSRRIVLN